ncbi:TetR/AcrR family transcriptional regulator [Paenibacillus arenilitoris]|uniref:TetR/AcrR family transcriptional regulator n=1 Tax=Paenibacillus arenilitoris TaxID=2772299 RepID=A0A927H730_9BACL|nr:TetR/AcrR family transcriptional regulator [Paenibacillus arenilitoris]MBD2871171.1 TetR/AcrR family transcriptional regulator [Paenibacillus arenilitoris]
MDDNQKRKPGRPKGGAGSTQTHILRAAAYLFMEQGYEKVSLEGVAQSCGVTKASVYYYFDNKSVLFTESLLFVLRSAYDHTEKIINGEGTLQERLTVVASRHMSNAHLEFETMMREAAEGLSAEQIARIRDSERAIHELLAGVFRKAMEAGEITRGDELLCAHLFTAMLSVKNRKEIVNVHKSAEQAAEEIVKLLMTGLVPRTTS